MAAEGSMSMHEQDAIDYHSTRAKDELDLGLTADLIAASRAHMQLAALHMQRLRELSEGSKARKPILRM
jgi:hypothetical protein